MNFRWDNSILLFFFGILQYKVIFFSDLFSGVFLMVAKTGNDNIYAFIINVHLF